MFGNIRDIAQLHIACHHSLALGARRRIENTRTHHFVGNSQKGRKAQDHIRVLCNIRIGKNSLHLAVCNHGNTICIVDNTTRSRRIYRSVEVCICLFAIAGSLDDRVSRVGAHTEHNCKDNAQYNKSGKSSENSGKHVFPLPLAESTRGRNLPRFIRSLSKRQATHDDKEQRRDQ